MRSLKKRGPHVLDDLMTSYFPYTELIKVESMPRMQTSARACVRKILRKIPNAHI